MSTPGPWLTAEGERAWLRLKQHLEWSDGFALGFLFSAEPAVVALFRERLADIYRARVTRLQQPVPAAPDDLLERVLPDLLHPPLHQQALHAPCWLDLTHGSGAAWRDARLAFLARLNEQREPLRRALERPLVLVLPAAERARIRGLVPDLWAIRDFAVDVGNWLAPAEPAPAAPEAVREAGPFPLAEHEEALLREWRRLRDKGRAGHDALAAAARAFDACSGKGRWEEAGAVAVWMERAARSRYADGDETPEALRDLSVSLDNVGRTAQAQGQWEAAGRAYEESLGLRRRLVERLGETPEALRDLSISLNNVGRTAQAQGQWEAAGRAYEESLGLRRRLVERLGETPEALRDLSISLDNVGGTAQAQGQWEAAGRAYEESLGLCRRLVERLGETPEALRDLSVSLHHVGRVAWSADRPGAARRAWNEGLAIARVLAAALPRLPQYSELPGYFEAGLEALGEKPVAIADEDRETR